MVPDQANSILETVAASIQGTGGLRDIPVQAGDTLKDLDLSRLQLLAVLIELEDKFAIEFTPDAIDGFRSVGDITFYIHTRELAPYDDVADERPAATCVRRLPVARVFVDVWDEPRVEDRFAVMPGVGREFIPRNRMRLILVWMMRMGHRIQVSVAIFLAALAAIMSSGPRARGDVSNYILEVLAPPGDLGAP
jgi:acyl carrier protein